MPVRGGWRGPWLGAQALLGLVACDGPTPPSVASLTVEPAAATLDLGFTQRFAVVARDRAGQSFQAAGAVWESSDTTVVSISADSGLATARAPGAAIVRATVQGVTAAAEIAVPRLTFASVSVGDRQICGVTTTDLAYCWGANMSGQLGNGDTTGELRVLPEPVAGGLRFQSIGTAHHHTCGVAEDGAAYCWGWNTAGELGYGSTVVENRFEPTLVAGAIPFTTVHVGGWFTCARTSPGAPYCWGDNIFGSLGDGTTTDHAVPLPVAGEFTFISLSSGEGLHSCGLNSQGMAYCWGVNQSGELGDSTTTNRSQPVPVVGNLMFQSISAGLAHSCGVTRSGDAYCWGSNDMGVLGDGTNVGHWAPGPVAGGLTFQFVGAGGLHTCGLTTDSTAYCWGYNLTGTLGQPPSQVHDSPVPIPVTGGLKFIWLVVGGIVSCGKATDGLVYCWGANPFGQLGIGTYSMSSYQPVPIFGQR